MAGGQANMNGMFRPGASIIIFEPLSEGVSRDADNGIHLRVKRFRTPKSVNRNAVLLYFVDCTVEILSANKSQESNRVVRPPEYTGRQNAVYFSPLGLKFADSRFQVLTPLENGPFDLTTPVLEASITEFFAPQHKAKHL